MKKNQSQIRAIAHLSGPMMVLAGPGSGKTSVIVERTEYLITHYKVPEDTILVVTFSRAAAREMKDRFLKIHGTSSSGVTFGTFHGVFYGIIKQAYKLNGDNIIRKDQKEQFLKELVYTYSVEMKDEKEFLQELESEISLVKGNRLELNHYYSANCPDDIFRNIYEGYVKRCRQERLLDFDDMLLYCYELFVKRPDILSAWQQKFQYILVDEFQDINQLQYDIVRMLAKPGNNLFIVGDDDQSIYHFRGAKPEIMLNFPKDYPEGKQIVLDVNYRSTGKILDNAGKLIAHNKNRYSKKLSTPNDAGEGLTIVEYTNPYEEAIEISRMISQMKNEGADLKEIAILTRTNMEASILVEKMMEYQLPFQIKDRLPNLYEHWIAGNMLAYMAISHGSTSRSDFLQIMNRPNRYISRDAIYENEVSFEGLRIHYEDKHWMCDRIDEMEAHIKRLRNMAPYAAINYIRHAIGYEEYIREYADYRRIKADELYDVLNRIQESARGFKSLEEWLDHIQKYTRETIRQQKEQNKRREGVTIATLHSAKGLEFAQVYILNVNEGSIPYSKAQLDTQIEEERRLFYVGMTRAKNKLTLAYVKNQFDKKLEPSRFLKEISK